MLSKSLTFSRSITFALFSTFAATSAVTAGMFPDDKEMPKDGIWQLGVEAQNFGQTNNLAKYSVAANPSTTPEPTLLSTPDADKTWGYTFYLGYVFPKHDYDIQANYTGVNDTAKNQRTSYSEDGKFNGSNNAEYNFSEAEITFGDYIKYDNQLMFRIGYGLAYANIKQTNANAAYNYTDPVSVDESIEQDYENKFWGIGPKLTLDGQFDFNKNLGAVGGIGAAILFGEAKQSMNGQSYFYDDSEEEGVYTPLNYEDKETRAVFGFDAKLGLLYKYQVNEQFQWNVEAGYKAATYIDALQSQSFTVADTPYNIYQADGNYSNYGPYFTFNVNFM